MDWQKIISDLSGFGVTQKDMAAHCGCGQSTISEIGRGVIKNPAYNIGKCLVDLYAEKVGAGETAHEPERQVA
jgi:predicted transcriptional regulator